MIKKKPLSKKTKAEIKRLRALRKTIKARIKAARKELVVKQKTLLGRFMQEKYNNYEEPQRKGTAKGKPIGFSSTKYSASLYMLTNLTHKDIAKKLKISHGLLRKWNVGKQFNEFVFNHHDEFIQVFVKFINTSINVFYKIEEGLMKKTFRQLSKLDPLSYRSQVQKKFNVSYDMLSDVGGYSDLLMNLLVDRLHAEIVNKLKSSDTGSKLVFLVEIDSIFSVIEHYRGWDFGEDMKKKRALIGTMASNMLIDKTIDIVSKPKMSNDDKKQVCVALKYLKRPVDNIKNSGSSKSKKRRTKQKK